jgi:antirestriction protein ArdC
MPYRGQFTSRDGFWATLFHELVHSTAKELKRSHSGDKDDPIYHREELVADLGASFLGNHFGLGSTELEHHATYLEHYWSLLNSDTKTFFNAVYEAQKAAHYLLEVGAA